VDFIFGFPGRML